MEINIVTYNILSTEFYLKNKTYPDSERIKLILERLGTYVAENRIICIQELSSSMYGIVALFFEAKNYVLHSAMYAYGLGIAIAAPRGIVTRCDLIRLRDKKTWPRYEVGWMQYLLSYVIDTPNYQSWRNASFKTPLMVCIEVQNKFCVATVHMPCSYKEPIIMYTYLALVRHAAAAFANKKPYILAGDFNIQPATKLYDEMLSGTFDHSVYEEYPPSDMWRPRPVSPLISAYAVANNVEPVYTNFMMVDRTVSFCGTLDYILCTPNITVKKCEVVYSSAEPQPNKHEPSDHLPITATLFC